MKKISVGIPTLQRNPHMKSLIQTLNNDPAVGEIIVLDNSCQGLDYTFPKMRVIIPSENMYINPSWNRLVAESKYDYWALFNDDLLVPNGFCSSVMPLLNEGFLLGMNSDYVCPIEINNFGQLPQLQEIFLTKSNAMRNYCFGTIMMGHKSVYHPIPEEMKILYGDDYLFYKNSNNVQLISGQPINHLGSITTSLFLTNPLYLSDKKCWENLCMELSHRKTKKYKIFGLTIFKIKKDQKSKKVKILGLTVLKKRQDTKTVFLFGFIPLYKRKSKGR